MYLSALFFIVRNFVAYSENFKFNNIPIRDGLWVGIFLDTFSKCTVFRPQQQLRNCLFHFFVSLERPVFLNIFCKNNYRVASHQISPMAKYIFVEILDRVLQKNCERGYMQTGSKAYLPAFLQFLTKLIEIHRISFFF